MNLQRLRCSTCNHLLLVCVPFTAVSHRHDYLLSVGMWRVCTLPTLQGEGNHVQHSFAAMIAYNPHVGVLPSLDFHLIAIACCMHLSRMFASWDFHLTDAAAAKNLRRSIRGQLKEMVNDAALADQIVDARTRSINTVRKVGDLIHFLDVHSAQNFNQDLQVSCLSWHMDPHCVGLHGLDCNR